MSPFFVPDSQKQMPQIVATPDFERPPVTEVAFSIEFSALEKWNSSHGALYWSTVQSDYPLLEAHPPLFPTVESFDNDSSKFQAVPQFQYMKSDSARTWLVGNPDTWLVQVQRDRFVLNWRKREGGGVYPRYEAVMRPRLQKEWARFKSFVAAHSLGEISAKLCEVTYVNDIRRGDGWEQVSDAVSLLSAFAEKSENAYLPELETLNVSGSYRFTNPPGRLHFSTQHLLRQSDGCEVMQLQLISRGVPVTSEDNDVFSSIDVGRERVVCGFADLTSKRAHELWGKFK